MSECKTGTTGNDSDLNPIVIDFYKLNLILLKFNQNDQVLDL